MSICIKAQKFLGNDLELAEFIQKDLKHFFGKKFREYFFSKETAIKIGECIKIHKEKELKELEKLKEIYESKDINLIEQKEVIEKNNSIERAKKRLIILDEVNKIENYIELTKLLEEYYKLKDYSTLLDIKYLSIPSQVIIFFHEGIYYTSIQSDEENIFIDFILSSEKFKDYSFDFNDTSKVTLKEKELKELIIKEEIWKSIYNSISSQEENKTQIAATFYFSVAESLLNSYDELKCKELLSLTKQNIK